MNGEGPGGYSKGTTVTGQGAVGPIDRVVDSVLASNRIRITTRECE